MGNMCTNEEAREVDAPDNVQPGGQGGLKAAVAHGNDGQQYPVDPNDVHVSGGFGAHQDGAMGASNTNYLADKSSGFNQADQYRQTNGTGPQGVHHSEVQQNGGTHTHQTGPSTAQGNAGQTNAQTNQHVTGTTQGQQAATVQEPVRTADPVRISQSTVPEDYEYSVSQNPLNPLVQKKLDILPKLTAAALQQHQAKFNTTAGSDKTLRDKREGSTYSGSVWENVPHGFGRLIKKDGSVYEGFFERGQPAHFIRYILTNGEMYEGEFNAGRPHGKGVKTDSQENTTECYGWKDGVEEGRTIKKNSKGKVLLNGNMKDGKLSGNCSSYNDLEKASYEGNYIAGILEGQGKKFYEDGRAYDGTFVKGVENGQGVLTFVDGRKFAGPFTNGRPNGKGQLTTDSGKTFASEWKDGKRVA